MSKDKEPDPLFHGLKWSYRDHNFKGYSIAGTTTSLVYENDKAVFDLGQGLPFNIPANNIFITHGHADHAAGLPYVLSQRSLWGLPTAQVFVPPHYYDNIKKLLDITQDMEGFQYNYELNKLPPGTIAEINPTTSVEAFSTIHRVPSQGYTLIKKKKRLKEDCQGLSQEEIIHLKNQGEEIEETHYERLFSFTGDTGIEFIDYLKPVKLLFMETTFIDHKKPVAAAREWGHIHLDEWVNRLEELPIEKLIIIHLSARYSMNFINLMLQQKIPKHLKDKVEVFPRPF